MLTELEACRPHPLAAAGFNPAAVLPYGLKVSHLQPAMQSCLDFLGFINAQLYTQQIARLETMLMPANFSSIVGEFLTASIPKYCPTLVRNRYHNGHPDLIPVGMFPDDAVQHAADGIEVKASRYLRGWQGHNPEAVWLLVIIFDSNRSKDTVPRAFRFVALLGAPLMHTDWTFAGRSATSRRTITASINASDYQKLMANWLYRDTALREVE